MSEPVIEVPADRLVVDVWSDVMCPFCYLGDTLLAEAIAGFAHRDRVEVRYHSYLLTPELPRGEELGADELLVRTKGLSPARAQQVNEQIAERAAQAGLHYRFDIARATNMRDAHRLSHFAADHGRQHETIVRLFEAYFRDGRSLASPAALADLAAEAGLDRDAALAALESDAYEDAVDLDIAAARAIGVQGVPFFVLQGKYAVSGAQPVGVFAQALEAAWAEVEPGE